MRLINLMTEVLNYLSNQGVAVLAGAVVSAAISIYASLVARKKLPLAHNVAVVGYPRSGKTTLITALFAEIFSRNISSISITPRGEETIKRINDDIARLESGRELGPTTDQDLFAYRAEMLTGKSIFAKRYKIEIGDFPGEDSKELATKEVEWLHELPYFKWVLNADAFIFIIDSANIAFEENPLDYRSKITSSFRAAWQKLKDHHYDGMKGLLNKPVVIVFSKLDLLVGNMSSSNKSTNRVPEVKSFTEEQLEPVKCKLMNDYNDLIRYFKSETKQFNVVFSSSFAKDQKDGVRVGAKKLLGSVLPR